MIPALRDLPASAPLYGLRSAGHVGRTGVSGCLLADGYSCRSQVKLIDGVRLAHPVEALLNFVTIAGVPERAAA